VPEGLPEPRNVGRRRLARTKFRTCLQQDRACRLGPKAAIFIDGANLHATAKALGIEIDYKKLLAEFARDKQMLRAYYATMAEDEFGGIRPLVDWLSYNGYLAETKPVKGFVKRTRIPKSQGRHGHRTYRRGDGSRQRRGVRVTAASTITTRPPMIAEELRRQADAFVDLADCEQGSSRGLVQPSSGNILHFLHLRRTLFKEMDRPRPSPRSCSRR
jgi:uncharacterized LabA/DUF88 family protein